MSDVDFNRLGLLLNVIATVLLSPQWFGARRLRRVESRLERVVHKVDGGVDGLTRRLRGKPGRLLLIVVGAFLVLVVAVVLFPIGLAMRFQMLPDEMMSILNTGLAIAGEAIAVFVRILIVCCVVIAPFVLLDFGLRLVQRVLRRLERSLDSGDRLSFYMVGVGVVLFAMGNTIQWIAAD
jgi:hypothetical protein